MDLQLSRTDMAFCYSGSFDGNIPEAYQKLLLDALRGDKTLFVSAEETELAWKKLDGLPKSGNLVSYKKGEVPESIFGDIWINFENYIGIC